MLARHRWRCKPGHNFLRQDRASAQRRMLPQRNRRSPSRVTRRDRRFAMLGMPCRARPAHVVPFGTIGIESRVEKLPPECGQTAYKPGLSNAGDPPAGWVKKRHDARLFAGCGCDYTRLRRN